MPIDPRIVRPFETGNGFPLDVPMKIGDALTTHYATHGLPTDGGEHNAWFHVRVGPMTIPLPNPPARRRAVFVHDVNHILTGYNTVFSDGEMVIAGFEVGAGCGRVWIAWLINIYMMAFGLFVRPRAVFDAFVRGRHSASLYRRTDERVRIRQMSVDEMRRLLRIEGTRRPTFGDRVAFVAWSLVAIGVAAGVPAAVVTGLWIAVVR